MKSKTVKADSKGRIALGPESAGREFLVKETRTGYQMDAVKTVTIPEDEAWLWENPSALASVLRGIEQSKKGETVYLGDFSEYADVDPDSEE